MRTSAIGISDTPIEVLERILDYLHDDRKALLAASLVSRKWAYTPRYHLFNRMILTDIPGRNHDLAEENADGFLALSQSEHCTILPAIRYIILLIGKPESIIEVVKILERAKRLSDLVYIPLKRWDPMAWNGHALPQIRDFSYNSSQYVFTNETWQLVTSFPNLRTLALYTDYNITFTFPHDISGSSFRDIRTLRLRLVASEELLDWLSKLEGSRFSLETFDLRLFRACHRGWGSVTALNSFLEENSETLEHLSLGIDYHHTAMREDNLIGEEPLINLRPLTHLRSLFMRTHDLSAVCDSLQSLSPSSALETLTVHALPWHLNGYLFIERCNCEFLSHLTRFASIIEGSQFTGIKSLDFSVPSGVELDAVADQLSKQRGALMLSHVVDEHYQCNSLDFFRPDAWSRDLRYKLKI